MPRSSQSARPHRRDGFWYLVRRVPSEFARLDKRTIVRMSTGIRIVDDPRGVRALRVVQEMDAALHFQWTELKAGRDPHAQGRLEWAHATARKFGFEYIAAAALEKQLEELVKRIEALTPLSAEERNAVRPALLGEVDVPKPGIRVADLLKEYESILAASLLKKSPGQLKRWRTTRQTALNVFVGLVGEYKLLPELTHADGFKLRDHWNGRVMKGEVQIDSANKQMGYVAAMFREVNDFKRLMLDDIFHRKSIKGGKTKERPSFDVEYVQDVLLAPGAMDKLNDEARGIFYVVAELGLRPIEVCGLTENTIHLDGKVPFIEITEDDGRELKNMNSKRDVPLVGIALEVMKAFPSGFPAYRDRSDNLSAVVQRHLSRNKLLQFKGQSFYSLRHTFKDRLRDAKVEEELKDMLMGHSTGKESYGRGYLLERKLEVLTSIAFKAPPFCVGQRAGVRGAGRLRGHGAQLPLQVTGKAKLGRYRPRAAQPPSARLVQDAAE